MKRAAHEKRASIESMYQDAEEMGVEHYIDDHICESYRPQTPFEQIYILKKLFSIMICLSEPHSLGDSPDDEIMTLCREAFRFYLYYVNEMLSEFYMVSQRTIALYLCKHLAALAQNTHIREDETATQSAHKGLEKVVSRFMSVESVAVSSSMVLIGHDLTLNSLLLFLLVDPNAIDASFQRVCQLEAYPPSYGEVLSVELVPNADCASGFEVDIRFGSQKIVPFFCKNKKLCDLLELLEYGAAVIELDVEQLKQRFLEKIATSK